MKKPIYKENHKPYSYIVDHIAKKNHNCRKCSTQITAGTKYYEKKIMTSSYMFYSEKYCADCFKLNLI